jgi:hypothetical protein
MNTNIEDRVEEHISSHIPAMLRACAPTLVAGFSGSNNRCGDRSEHLLDEAVGALDLIRDFGVGHHGSWASGGSFHSSA